jgi:hypothetical protein
LPTITLRIVPVFLIERQNRECDARKSVRLGALCVIPAQEINPFVSPTDLQGPPSGEMWSSSLIAMRSCNRHRHRDSRGQGDWREQSSEYGISFALATGEDMWIAQADIRPKASVPWLASRVV